MSTRAHGNSRSRHRHSQQARHRSKSSSRKKPNSTTVAAQELVASFKTMTLSRSMLEPAVLPAIASLDDEDETAFTLLDGMSFTLGGDCGGGDSLDTRLNIHDAMNTVSSGQSSRGRSPRDRRDGTCHRCRHRRRHARHQRQADDVAGDSTWRRRLPLPAAARRSYFGGFERFDNSVDVEEAAPLPTPQPLTERAQEVVQPPGAACWLFRCVELPRLSRTAASVQSASKPPPTTSPLSTSATGTTASEHPRQRQRHRHCRHRHRCLDSGDAKDDLRDRQRHRSRRRRSLRQLESVGDEAEASVDDSVVDISASTLAVGGGGGVWSAAAARRHLLEPPMPPSYRVRVPTGASSGQPPPKPPTATSAATAAAANAALVYGGRLTRTAARTARSVSRRLRRAMCGRNGEAEAGGGRPTAQVESLQRCPASGLPTTTDEQRQQQQPAGVSELCAASCGQLSNANANNDKAADRSSCSDDEDYSSLLRTLDRARRRQRKQTASKQLRAEISSAAAQTRLEFFVDVSKSSASSKSSIVSEISKTPSPPLSGQLAATRDGQRSHGSLSRKIELINSMAESLLGLSQSLKGCVGNINRSLGLMREPE